MDDDAFIDDVAARAKTMIEHLRQGVPDNGEPPIKSASEFLTQRIDDPPQTEEQLSIVLSTLIAVHRYRMTRAAQRSPGK